jgi:zinc and cadmium transporter
MAPLISTIIATLIISLISLIGVITISMKKNLMKKLIMGLVALSAGALIGGAFLHLIPEAIEEFGEGILIYVLIGFTVFFLIEKILHWRHCHEVDCKIHSFAYMSLIGDAAHNLIDGLIIGVSFTVNVSLGVASTIAIALHEIPQELGDFAVLIHGGFSKRKALLANFLTALTAVLGGIIGYYLVSFVENAMMYLLPFAAGGFIYISASDLLPELRKEVNVKKAIINFLIFLLGIGLMFIVKFV